MKKNWALVLIIVFSININLLADEDHKKLDDDGFELMNQPPSKEILNSINSAYQKNIEPIFKQHCLRCHGKVDKYPWYFSVPGPKQLMEYDIREAKSHMDMTNGFPFKGGHGAPVDDLIALEKSIKKSDMPPFRYRIINWNSLLTEDEQKILFQWTRESILKLKK